MYFLLNSISEKKDRFLVSEAQAISLRNGLWHMRNKTAVVHIGSIARLPIGYSVTAVIQGKARMFCAHLSTCSHDIGSPFPPEHHR